MTRNGNITGRHLADAVRRFSEGLADYNPESILCLLAEYRIIIPHRCSWRGASRGLLSSLAHRSRGTGIDADNFMPHNLCAWPSASIPGSPVMAPSLQRYHPWERTSNAGMKLSKSAEGAFIPFYLIADGNPSFFSHIKNFF